MVFAPITFSIFLQLSSEELHQQLVRNSCQSAATQGVHDTRMDSFWWPVADHNNMPERRECCWRDTKGRQVNRFVQNDIPNCLIHRSCIMGEAERIIVCPMRC